MQQKSRGHGHGPRHEQGHRSDPTRRQPVRSGRLNETQKALQLAALKAELHQLERLSRTVPADPRLKQRMAHLQDIIAFESVDQGPTLFEGLQERGVALDPPELLTDAQCAERSIQITNELAEVGVFLFGHEYMAPRDFYSTLWHHTLREGCYLKRRHSPASVVMIDVSRQIPREVMQSFLEFLQGGGSVH